MEIVYVVFGLVSGLTLQYLKMNKLASVYDYARDLSLYPKILETTVINSNTIEVQVVTGDSLNKTNIYLPFKQRGINIIIVPYTLSWI